MFKDDYPLLSAPSLMTVILRAAQSGPVTIEDCEARLAELLATADVKPGLPADGIRERLTGHLASLETAGLLEAVPGGGRRLTLRGREALRIHPDGIDPTDLMIYPEFASHIGDTAAAGPSTEPREGSFDLGYVARSEGQPFTANPYRPHTADHQAWENGWMQALDDGK